MEVSKSEFTRLLFIGGDSFPKIVCGAYGSWIFLEEDNADYF
jgi:hypothetical protein